MMRCYSCMLLICRPYDPGLTLLVDKDTFLIDVAFKKGVQVKRFPSK